MSSSVPDPADLTAFLEAQWAEDERVALPFRNPQGHAKRWQCDETGGKVRQVGTPEFGLPDVVSESDTHLTAEHIARHDPARVLADAAAKRAILTLHKPATFTSAALGIINATVCFTCHVHLDRPDHLDSDAPWPYPLVQEAWPCKTVRALAQSFRGVPGWRNEWAIED